MSEAATTLPRIGERVPDFTLTALDGSSLSLSCYRGKRVAVFMWASW